LMVTPVTFLSALVGGSELECNRFQRQV
jgi:hypothetical protein